MKTAGLYNAFLHTADLTPKQVEYLKRQAQQVADFRNGVTRDMYNQGFTESYAGGSTNFRDDILENFLDKYPKAVADAGGNYQVLGRRKWWGLGPHRKMPEGYMVPILHHDSNNPIDESVLDRAHKQLAIALLEEPNEEFNHYLDDQKRHGFEVITNPSPGLHQPPAPQEKKMPKAACNKTMKKLRPKNKKQATDLMAAYVRILANKAAKNQKTASDNPLQRLAPAIQKHGDFFKALNEVYSDKSAAYRVKIAKGLISGLTQTIGDSIASLGPDEKTTLALGALGMGAGAGIGALEAPSGRKLRGAGRGALIGGLAGGAAWPGAIAADALTNQMSFGKLGPVAKYVEGYNPAIETALMAGGGLGAGMLGQAAGRTILGPEREEEKKTANFAPAPGMATAPQMGPQTAAIPSPNGARASALMNRLTGGVQQLQQTQQPQAAPEGIQ